MATRYRGYYYDTRSSFYYLNSRYYDPEVCRFINADEAGLLGVAPTGLTDKNLYAYCDNNPIIREDDGGAVWGKIICVIAAGGVIGGIMGGLSAAASGDDFWDGVTKGAITGAAGSAMGLAKLSPYIAGIAGFLLDCAYQAIPQIINGQQEICINIGSALKTGCQAAIGAKVKPFGSGTDSVANAVGTSVVWAETTVLTGCADIVVTDIITDIVSDKKSQKPKPALSASNYNPRGTGRIGR